MDFNYDSFNKRIGIGTTTPDSKLDVNGTVTFNGLVSGLVTKTSNYTVSQNDYTVLGDATSGGITFTLPIASSNTGRIFYIKKIDSSVNTVTIDGNGSETIDEGTTAIITNQYEAITVQSDGSNWHIL